MTFWQLWAIQCLYYFCGLYFMGGWMHRIMKIPPFKSSANNGSDTLKITFLIFEFCILKPWLFANCEPFYVCIIFVDSTSWAGCLLKVSCYLIFKSQFVRGASIKWRILTTSTMCCWDELSLLPPSQSFLKLHLAT